MGTRFGLRFVVAPAAWMVAGVVGFMAAAPAYAHVDPNAPVAGSSLARASSVAPYGQARGAAVASASYSGDTVWLLMTAALVGTALLVAAGWQMWRSVNRRQAAGAGVSSPDAIDDPVGAELRQITEAATGDDRLEKALH